MVANLSAHKRGWDDKWEEYSKWAEKGISYQNQLLNLVDEDTNAFNQIMNAYSLPKESENDISKRNKAIQDATKNAILIPFKIMKKSFDSMQIMKKMAEIGNPNSITDAGVGALCARTAVIGAFLNVKINCNDYDDKNYVNEILSEGQKIVDQCCQVEQDILKIVNEKID